MNIAEFLQARYDEEEDIAKLAIPPGGSGRWSSAHESCMVCGVGDDDDEIIIYDEGGHDEMQADHIALHDPARVLADLEVKRFLLAPHYPTGSKPAFEDDDDCHLTYDEARNLCNFCGPGDHWSVREYEPGGHAWWPCRPIRMMASVYAEHPDFDPDWRVD